MKNKHCLKQRDTSLDIICGVLIIHMIAGHILGNFNTLSNLSWYVWESRMLFFFMPWFFFKNGMFFHPTDSWREMLARDARRYLRPFVIWSVIGECVRWADVVLSEHAGSWQWYAASIKTLFLNGQMVGNDPLWFLSALFLARILFNVIVRHAHLAPFALLASALVAASFWWFDLNRVLFVPHVFAGLFYFGCGYFLRERQRSGRSIALAGVALFVLTLISPSRINMFSNTATDGNLYLFGMVRAVAAIVLVNNLLAPPARWLPCKVLAVIGRDSMSYYVTHFVLLLLLQILLVRLLGVTGAMDKFLLMLAGCIVLLPVVVWVLKRKTTLLRK